MSIDLATHLTGLVLPGYEDRSNGSGSDQPGIARLLQRQDDQGVGHDTLHRAPPSFDTLRISAEVAISTTEDSIKMAAPFPLRVLKVQAGAKTAGDTCTAMLKNDAGDNVLAAAIDVKAAATAGAATVTTVMDSIEDATFDVGDQMYFELANGATTALAGFQAWITVQRL